MKRIMALIYSATLLASCNSQKESFDHHVDRFADAQILRYQVEGFEELPLEQKELIYYLSEAAVSGRDILFDQNCKWNLPVRRILETIYLNFKGDKTCSEYQDLEVYLKLIWMNNGIHHNYSSEKMKPAFSEQFFKEEVLALDSTLLPLRQGESVAQFLSNIKPILFDPAILSIRVNQTDGHDLVVSSANNYYDGVTQEEAEVFYDKMRLPDDHSPLSYGLNSRLIKEDGKVVEKVWKVGGIYSSAIEKILFWLEKALPLAETQEQRLAMEHLLVFYCTGDLKTFDDYSIAWVKDTVSNVDFVNGFIETYGDPLGLKASWESIVNFKNVEATKRTEIISSNAQWFEDHSPVETRFKKEQVKGVSAKVITIAMLGGDCYPVTPIGINLPNSNWIRKDFGSKSVTIENIAQAYDNAAQGNGFLEEFVWSEKEHKLINEYGFQVDNMHTDLHECLGHGSGKLLSGVSPDALKAYGAPLEETRADLFALYYIADPKMVALGLLPNAEAYKAEYYRYLMNGSMTQLTRIKRGRTIEQAHMRNRQTIARWILEKGAENNVVELRKKDGKTFLLIHNYERLRALFGQLLAEVQRIRSTGDYDAAKALIEKYGIQVDALLHNEILNRYQKLDIAPWRGFVNPVYSLVKDADGKAVDVKISYEESYLQQMLRYSKEYSFLPSYNQ